jgi:hypothetical protein
MKSILFRTFKVFISAWLLAEIVLSGVVLNFVGRLNDRGLVDLGENFQGTQLFWGDGLFMNIVHLVIGIVFAGIFGFLFGYLIKREVKVIEKVVVSALNTILAIFASSILIIIVLAFMGGLSRSEIFSVIPLFIASVTDEPFYLIFFLLNLVGIFWASYFYIDKGVSALKNTPYPADAESSGTLLGVKWYHYLWLWIPIGFYGQYILSFIFGIFKVVIGFFQSVQWFEFLGVTTTGKDSIGSTYWGIVLLFIFAYYIILLLEYLRTVLADEKVMSKSKKTLTALGLGIVLPIVLVFFVSFL